MNRHQRRAAASQRRIEARRTPDALVPVPKSDWPGTPSSRERLAVWLSRKVLVQVFAEPNDIIRISVNSTRLDVASSRWEQGLAWEQLQAIKNQIGYHDRDAVEVYPRVVDEVDVANMRHLWVLPEPLPFAWRRS